MQGVDDGVVAADLKGGRGEALSMAAPPAAPRAHRYHHICLSLTCGYSVGGTVRWPCGAPERKGSRDGGLASAVRPLSALLAPRAAPATRALPFWRVTGIDRPLLFPPLVRRAPADAAIARPLLADEPRRDTDARADAARAAVGRWRAVVSIDRGLCGGPVRAASPQLPAPPSPRAPTASTRHAHGDRVKAPEPSTCARRRRDAARNAAAPLRLCGSTPGRQVATLQWRDAFWGSGDSRAARRAGAAVALARTRGHRRLTARPPVLQAPDAGPPAAARRRPPPAFGRGRGRRGRRASAAARPRGPPRDRARPGPLRPAQGRPARPAAGGQPGAAWGDCGGWAGERQKRERGRDKSPRPAAPTPRSPPSLDQRLQFCGRLHRRDGRHARPVHAGRPRRRRAVVRGRARSGRQPHRQRVARAAAGAGQGRAVRWVRGRMREGGERFAATRRPFRRCPDPTSFPLRLPHGRAAPGR